MADVKPPDAESLRLELREAITAYHGQLTLLGQSLGLIITADTLLLAYGFAQRRSGILLLGSLLPIAMLVMYIDFMRSLVPISYVAINLEKKLSLHDAPLIGTYARTRQGMLPVLLGGIGSSDELRARGFVPKIPLRFLLKDPKSLLLLCAFVAQLCIFVVSITAYNYRFM
jgi:hypothetical protein